MALAENIGGGRRSIVIENVPAGTGIADLVAAFSPFGAIKFAYMGPPAVIGFEKEGSADHALLVSSMKTASLLGYEEKKVVSASAERPVTEPAAPSEHAAPETKTTQIETVAAGAAAAPTEAAVAETKTCPDKASTAPPAVIVVDRETINSIRDSVAALEKNALVDREAVGTMGNAIAAVESHVSTMKQLLVERCNDEYDLVEEDVNDDLDHDKCWSDGYNLGFWGNSNHYEAWLAGYQAGVKDSRWKEGDTPIHGNPMLAN